MLKEEIDKLESIDQLDNFLENTKCGFLLEELQKTPDIQIYFKNVILKTVEKIERNFSFREIKLSISEIKNLLDKVKNEEEKKAKKKIDSNINELYEKYVKNILNDQSIYNSEDEISQKDKEKNLIFTKKYIPNLEKNELEERSKNAKSEKKNNLAEYFDNFENNMKSNGDDNLYSNSVLLDNIYNTNISVQILSLYKNDFIEIISFIDQLIQDLTNNILLLPNSIKYICKIISILIKKKIQKYF